MKARGVGLLAVSLLWPVMGDAKEVEPLRLAPTSPWNVHFADDSCLVGRAFGEGDQRITFRAARYDDGDELRLSFFGKSLRTRTDGAVRMRFHPYEQVRMADYFSATGADDIPALVLTSPVRLYDTVEEAKKRTDAMKDGDYNYRSPAVTPDQEAAISFLELSGRFLPHVILETGFMGNVMVKLRECTDSLLREWGLDVARHKRLSVRAQPIISPGRWLSSGDYPMRLVERGVRGIVNFRLMIDAEGGVTGCHIQQSTRPAEFDEVVCKALARRAKFRPALDDAGQPMPSYYRNSVRFSL